MQKHINVEELPLKSQREIMARALSDSSNPSLNQADLASLKLLPKPFAPRIPRRLT
jgi:hypothetical protein